MFVVDRGGNDGELVGRPQRAVHSGVPLSAAEKHVEFGDVLGPDGRELDEGEEIGGVFMSPRPRPAARSATASRPSLEL